MREEERGSINLASSMIKHFYECMCVCLSVLPCAENQIIIQRLALYFKLNYCAFKSRRGAARTEFALYINLCYSLHHGSMSSPR